MSSKTAVKFVADDGGLFKLVAVLTGSKNALKGAGFFIGAALLAWRGFDQALWLMAVALLIVLALLVLFLPDLGRAKSKPALTEVLKKSRAIKQLSIARFFLFGARDIWFVVALPVFLGDVLGWSFRSIGAFLAVWVIGYGAVQSVAPRLLRRSRSTPLAAAGFLLPMALVVSLIAVSVWVNELKALVTVLGLLGFGVMFALTSSVHSYLILAYSTSDDAAAMDVGFYYSANAAGRLVGTLLSGVLFLVGGFPAALIGAAVFLIAALVVSIGLPPVPSSQENHGVVAVS